ncbi:hypothetical protein ACU4GD_24005 [Cupriavidus basilensis]
MAADPAAREIRAAPVSQLLRAMPWLRRDAAWPRGFPNLTDNDWP